MDSNLYNTAKCLTEYGLVYVCYQYSEDITSNGWMTEAR
jgi:hypothetical protein